MVEADPSAFTSPVDRFSQTRTPLSSRPASTPGTPRSLTSLGPSVSLHSGLRLLRRRRRLSAESLPAPALSSPRWVPLPPSFRVYGTPPFLTTGPDRCSPPCFRRILLPGWSLNGCRSPPDKR